jgi:hypothetical protein
MSKKSLTFLGSIWVSAVTALMQNGDFSGTIISPGRKMTWPEFLEAYKSGALWQIKPGEFPECKEVPLGALVKPTWDNRLVQPVTRKQVYIIDRGFWKIRGMMDPSWMDWALKGSYDHDGIIGGLEESPATIPDRF